MTTSRREAWFDHLISDENSKRVLFQEMAWAEDRKHGFLELGATGETTDGAPFRYRWLCDGKATSYFLFPDGAELHNVIRSPGLDRTLGSLVSPSCFAGLRISGVDRSLAVLLRQGEVSFLGQERIKGARCEKLSIRTRQDGSAVHLLLAVLDPTAMLLPRRLELSVEAEDRALIPQWKISIDSFQDIRDGITGEAIPFPHTATYHLFFDGKPAETINYDVVAEINPDLSAEMFSTDPERLPVGTLVQDTVNSSDGKAFVVGDRTDLYKARTQRLSARMPPKPTHTPVKATGRHSYVLYTCAGITLSLALIAVGVILRKRVA